MRIPPRHGPIPLPPFAYNDYNAAGGDIEMGGRDLEAGANGGDAVANGEVAQRPATAPPHERVLSFDGVDHNPMNTARSEGAHVKGRKEESKESEGEKKSSKYQVGDEEEGGTEEDGSESV